MTMGTNSMSTTSIHVTLPKALKEHIEKRVRDGEFTSPSDYVRALVRAERAYQEKRAALRRDIDAGLADIEAGRVYDGEEVFAELLRERSRPPSVWRGSPSPGTPGRICRKFATTSPKTTPGRGAASFCGFAPRRGSLRNPPVWAGAGRKICGRICSPFRSASMSFSTERSRAGSCSCASFTAGATCRRSSTATSDPEREGSSCYGQDGLACPVMPAALAQGAEPVTRTGETKWSSAQRLTGEYPEPLPSLPELPVDRGLAGEQGFGYQPKPSGERPCRTTGGEVGQCARPI